MKFTTVGNLTLLLVDMVFFKGLLLEFTLLLMVELFDPSLTGSLFHFSLECRVIMILNVIIGTTFQVLCYLGPAVAIDLVVLKDLVVLFHGPFHLFDVWIEVIVPSK